MLSHVLRTTDGSITSRLQRRAFEKILRLELFGSSRILTRNPSSPRASLASTTSSHPKGLSWLRTSSTEALGKVPVGVVHAGTRRPLCNPFAETDDPSAETDPTPSPRQTLYLRGIFVYYFSNSRIICLI